MLRPPSTQRSPGISDGAEHEAVLTELEGVVGSAAFDGSQRQIRLLRFLTEEVLAGRGGELRAPIIATRFFGRPEGFDSVEDSIVRVEVSKLRKSLERHYAVAPPGAVRIELPRGSYAPRFTRTDLPQPSTPPQASARRTGLRPPEPEPPPLPRGELDSVIPSSREVDLAVGGPVLAVLPFVGVTAVSTTLRAPAPDTPLAPETGTQGARGRSFAHGLTERLCTLFADVPCTQVVSSAQNLDDAAARGARYALEGSVRLLPGALCVMAKLHDTRRGVVAWGSTFERFDADDRLFALEAEIAREITMAVMAIPLGAVHVIEAGERGGERPRSVYEFALLFPRWFATFDQHLHADLEDAGQRLLGAGPERGLLLAGLSIVRSLSQWTRRGAPRGQATALALARRAVAVEPKLVNAHQALALALLDAGDGRGALAEVEIALGLGGPLMLTAMVMALAGAWERGTAFLHKHLTALKQYPRGIHHALCLDAYRRGDYAAALLEAEAIATPNLAFDPLDRAICLARLGDLPRARAAGRALNANLPEAVRDPRALASRLTADPALIEDIAEGLRLAGVG